MTEPLVGSLTLSSLRARLQRGTEELKTMTSIGQDTAVRTARQRRNLYLADEERRLEQAIRARRGLTSRVGRAWINGSEVGGQDPRYSHLSDSHD